MLDNGQDNKKKKAFVALQQFSLICDRLTVCNSLAAVACQQ